ncbi:MAG: Glu/Leu/Phe/Val dehydrogenase [Bacteroidetes bacterium OLB9]|nr:MAG: Glu/Leu/Phe/Val dehydrogenase [Bacteroidetes bacterium OLB9]
MTADQINRLIKNGLQVVACGANVPFYDDKIFFGETARYTDTQVSLIPDFVANCGMARTFAYLMEDHDTICDKGIFNDVSDTIYNFLKHLYEQDISFLNLSKRSLNAALKLVAKK